MSEGGWRQAFFVLSPSYLIQGSDQPCPFHIFCLNIQAVWELGENIFLKIPVQRRRRKKLVMRNLTRLKREVVIQVSTRSCTPTVVTYGIFLTVLCFSHEPLCSFSSWPCERRGYCLISELPSGPVNSNFPLVLSPFWFLPLWNHIPGGSMLKWWDKDEKSTQFPNSMENESKLYLSLRKHRTKLALGRICLCNHYTGETNTHPFIP